MLAKRCNWRWKDSKNWLLGLTLYGSGQMTFVVQVNTLFYANLRWRFRHWTYVKITSSLEKCTLVLLRYVLIDHTQICQRGSTRAVLGKCDLVRSVVEYCERRAEGDIRWPIVAIKYSYTQNSLKMKWKSWVVSEENLVLNHRWRLLFFNTVSHHNLSLKYSRNLVEFIECW